MALDFPASPSNGQTYSGGGTVWQWDGAKWTSAIGAAISIVVGPTPPAFQAGVLWWDNNAGQLFVAYDDGNSQQWVVATNMMTPTTTYAGNVGRNLIHNSQMTIAQRGAGPFTGGFQYTLDRWCIAVVGDTYSISQGLFGDAGRASIGDEEANIFLSTTVTGTAGATAFCQLQQRIENPRRLAGKTVIVSFWASTATALKLGVAVAMDFGTGGSPSAAVQVQGVAFQLSTTWTRYSATFTFPSAAGKTFGTNNNGFALLQFCCSAGANSSPGFGNIGVQSGVVYLWGVQCEIATPGQTQPTPLEKRDPVYELQQCQRFYQANTIFYQAYQVAGIYTSVWYPFPVTMRASPVLGYSSITYVNGSGITGLQTSSYGTGLSWITTAQGTSSITAFFSASADL